MTTNEQPERMAWSGTCRDCLANWIVYPHYEAEADVVEQTAEGPDEWEGFSTCQVCDGTIEWNGNDLVGSVIRND